MRTLFALILLAAGFGCSKQDPTPAAGQSHHHQAPHGGVLVELGEHQFNLEFKFDEKRGVLQVWVLDGHAENFVRVPSRGFEVEAVAGDKGRLLDFVAVANSMTGETVGDTSLFEVEAEWLRIAKAFDGRVKAITVRNIVFKDVAFRFSTIAEDHGHAH